MYVQVIEVKISILKMRYKFHVYNFEYKNYNHRKVCYIECEPKCT